MQRRPEERLRFDKDASQLAVLKAALALYRRHQSLVCEVSLTEVPAEDGTGDRLAVGVEVIAERIAVGRLREQHAEHPALQVEGTERQEARVRLHRLLRGEKAPLLLVEQRRGALQLVELLVAAVVKQPGVPSPVAGVVAHGNEEGDLRREEVADQRQEKTSDEKIDGEQPRADGEQAD